MSFFFLSLIRLSPSVLEREKKSEEYGKEKEATKKNPPCITQGGDKDKGEGAYRPLPTGIHFYRLRFSAQLTYHGRKDFKHVPNNAVRSDREYGGILILIDSDDAVGGRHADEVLHRS